MNNTKTEQKTGTVDGIIFAVSNDGGQTGVAWLESVFDALEYLALQNRGGRTDYAVVAVKRSMPNTGYPTMSTTPAIAAHTPGPWTIKPIRSGDKTIEIIEPAVSVDYDDVPHKEAEANARLIAAAPIMLSQLRNIEGMASKMAEHKNASWCAVRDLARAAIAKATSA